MSGLLGIVMMRKMLDLIGKHEMSSQTEEELIVAALCERRFLSYRISIVKALGPMTTLRSAEFLINRRLDSNLHVAGNRF